MSGIAPAAPVTRSDVDLAADGDEHAFARLVANHYRGMIQVAYVITGDAGLAQDAVQSAWTKAWTRLRTVRDAERIERWLLRIAANEARQIVRGRRRATVVEIDPELHAAPSADPGHGIERLDPCPGAGAAVTRRSGTARASLRRGRRRGGAGCGDRPLAVGSPGAPVQNHCTPPRRARR
jgi:RNA polymerase sigma-70 factor (ECF subfamily)